MGAPGSSAGASDDASIVRTYHELSKHAFQRYAPGPGGLDWANQPDPFKRYVGTELVALARDLEGETVAFDDAVMERLPPARVDARTLARFFYDSLALSAWKELGTSRWSLRVNPSSGNLHPTEAYLLSGAVPGLSEAAAVWHYAPHAHGLERRCVIPEPLWTELLGPAAGAGFLVGLGSVLWREAWKYGERAFRYCNHDVGHAIGALAYAAAGLGWRARLVDRLSTVEVGTLLGLAEDDEPETEHPDALLWIGTAPPRDDGVLPPLRPAAVAAVGELAWQGTPGRLSREHVVWNAARRCVRATSKPRTNPGAGVAVVMPAALHSPPQVELRTLVRTRRSAVAMDGVSGTDSETFTRILAGTLVQRGRAPWQVLPWSPRVSLVIFVHRVEGVDPGLYVLVRDPGRREALRAALRPEFLWEEAPCAPRIPLELLLPGDLRQAATSVSCHQAIAGDGAFSLGMLADQERSLGELGPWFYPRLYWECGLVGQALYLEAEAAGLRATGIGCYFDDPMHGLLGCLGGPWQDLYHFTVGCAVDDARLTSRPAYGPRCPVPEL